MVIRNGLLGLSVLVSVAGLATATPAPPINPQVEGRESNPVEREFYQPEKSVERNGSGPVSPSQPKGEWVDLLKDWSVVLEKAWELLVNDSFLVNKGVPDRSEWK